MPTAGTDMHGGDGYRAEADGGGAAMPGRPIANPKGGGPGMEDNGIGAATRHIDKRASAEVRRTGGGKYEGESHNSAAKMPDDQDVKHPAIKGAGGGSAKRGAKTATETPQADGQTKPGQGGGDDGEDAVWQPKSTWEHGWGSESTPDDSLSGDDGDEPDELEK